MDGHNHKLEQANVVGVFDTQAEADEAVLELRAAGFPDRRVGYFARDGVGLVTDYLGKGYTLAGTAVGLLVGAALGVWAGRYAMDIHATQLGPPIIPGELGVLVSAALCGAVLLGVTGAMIGWGIPRGDAVHRGTEVELGQFLVSVRDDRRGGEAWTILQRHGGHRPAGAIPVM